MGKKELINFYIPDFYNHFYINTTLLKLIQTKPEMFYDDFKIGAIYGNFPHCIWNGGTVEKGGIPDINIIKRIVEIFNYEFNIPLRLTMTNPLISKKHVYDTYSNSIMKLLNNGINQVLISSSILEEYIRKEYPNYPIIRSILASENKEYDDSNKYFMSVLKKNKNNDISFLKQIKNKNKVELLVNEICPSNCKRAYSHYLDFAKAQLFNEYNEILNLNCSYPYSFPLQEFYKHPLCLKRKEIKTFYEPLGFKHYKISGRGKNNPNIILYYAHYFVKEEFKDDFIGIMAMAFAKDEIRCETSGRFQ